MALGSHARKQRTRPERAAEPGSPVLVRTDPCEKGWRDTLAVRGGQREAAANTMSQRPSSTLACCGSPADAAILENFCWNSFLSRLAISKYSDPSCAGRESQVGAWSSKRSLPGSASPTRDRMPKEAETKTHGIVSHAVVPDERHVLFELEGRSVLAGIQALLRVGAANAQGLERSPIAGSGEAGEAIPVHSQRGTGAPARPACPPAQLGASRRPARRTGSKAMACQASPSPGRVPGPWAA